MLGRTPNLIKLAEPAPAGGSALAPQPETAKLRWFTVSLLAVLVLSCTSYLSLSYGKPKFVRSEIAYAEQSREMLQHHSWMQSYYHSQPCIDKPGMIFWTIIPSFKLLGLTPQAARMPSVLAAIILLAVLAASMRPIFGGRTAILAALMLASSARFIEFSASCMTDMLLTLFDTATLLCLYTSTVSDKRKTLWFVTAGVCAGCAVLTKGPVGLILPAASFGLYLGLTKQLKHLFSWNALLGFAVCIAAVAPWVWGVAARDGGTLLNYWFWHFNVGRFAGSSFANNYNALFVLQSFFLGFAPWSFFVPLALVSFIRGYKQEPRHQGQYQLLTWLFVGLTLLFFSISKGKINYYDLPTFPCAAAAVAVQSTRWFETGAKIGIVSGWSLGICFLASAVFACMLLPHIMGQNAPWYVVTMPLFLGAAVCFRQMKNAQTERAFFGAAVTILLSTVAVSALVLPAIAQQAPALSYLHRLQSEKREYRLAMDRSFAQFIDWLDHALFFTGKLPQWTTNSQERSAFLTGKGLAFIILPKDLYDQLPGSVRARTTVIESKPYISDKLTLPFLLERNGTLTGPTPLLLVSNESASPTQHRNVNASASVPPN